MLDLTQKDCERVLTSNYYGHLGYIHSNGEPHVLPITYLYQDGNIYSYTKEGEKLESMRKNPSICVQVEHVKNGFEWESVLCWGLFEEITDANDAHDIAVQIAEAHGKIVLATNESPVSPPLTHLQEGIENNVVYRLKPRRMTGKSEQR